MNITKLMSRSVVTVTMDDSLSHVKAIFEATSFHHLLVVENNKLCGVISDRDLLKSISPKVDTVAATSQDLATLNKRAHQIMTRNPVVLSQAATVVDAVKIFDEYSISCIPVVNDDHEPVGIISWRDIIKLLAKKYTAAE